MCACSQGRSTPSRMGSEVVSSLALSGLQRTGWPSPAGRAAGTEGAVLEVQQRGPGRLGGGRIPLPSIGTGWWAVPGPGLVGKNGLGKRGVQGPSPRRQGRPSPAAWGPGWGSFWCRTRPGWVWVRFLPAYSLRRWSGPCPSGGGGSLLLLASSPGLPLLQNASMSQRGGPVAPDGANQPEGALSAK